MYTVLQMGKIAVLNEQFDDFYPTINYPIRQLFITYKCEYPQKSDLVDIVPQIDHHVSLCIRRN